MHFVCVCEREREKKNIAMAAVHYMTLPSNSSMKYFPDNTVSQYTTKLATPLMFASGQYEIGLSDFQYVNSWNNVSRGEGFMEIEDLATDVRLQATLKDGYYQTPTILVDSINGLLGLSSVADVSLHLDKVTQKVQLSVGPGWAIYFSAALTDMLGFTSSFYGPGEHFGEFVVDIDRGFHALYVYCSLIKSRIVGDTTAQLLKVVPKKGKHGEVVSMSFNNIQFHEIQCSNVSEVSIHIKMDDGRNVAFERGKCVATLAYRKKGFSL